MTRYERIVKGGVSEMAIAMAFCIITYIEQSAKVEYSCETIREFVSENSKDLEEWLMQEVEK